jgi:hypothetical protein
MGNSFWNKSVNARGKMLFGAVIVMLSAMLLFVVCGSDDKKDNPVGPPTGCTQWGSWQVTLNPTCNAAGSQTRTCAPGAGTGSENAPVPQLPASDPQCQTGYVCQVGVNCHAPSSCVSNVCVPPATGCSQWSDWHTTLAPTCNAQGSQSRTCLVGTGGPETQPIPQLPASDPQCQTSGCQMNVNCFAPSSCVSNVCVPPATGCSQWSAWTVSVAASCNAQGSETRTCLAGTGGPETQTIPQLPASDPRCQTGPPPTGSFCFWPASGANLAACAEIGGEFCMPGENCSEAECRNNHGTVIADCNNPPVTEYCNWGLTAGDECWPIAPGMHEEHTHMTNREACQEFAFVSQFPNCQDFTPPQHFCRWPAPTGCVAIANPNAPNADNAHLTNVENCQENGRYFTSMAACEAFVPPPTDSQVRDFGPCTGGSGWNCTTGGCYAGGTEAQMEECRGGAAASPPWCAIRDRCPAGHCPPAAAGQPHCM